MSQSPAIPDPLQPIRRQQNPVAVIGGGPAGLMAAEVLSAAGRPVIVFEAMPTVGRKLLLAGKSGLNISHSEPHGEFAKRFGAAEPDLRRALDAFTAEDICAWASGLGVETFTGTSGRIFPKAMKASPLLRSWLARLRSQGVDIRTRHRFLNFTSHGIKVDTPDGQQDFTCDAVLMAMGGASWPKLGSDAAWVPLLAARGIDVAAFRPANCGFDVDWNAIFVERFAGAPVKSVSITSDAGTLQGEFVISRHGVEGSLVYAHAAALRDRLEREGEASIVLDLTPGRDATRLARDLARQKSKDSFSSRLRKAAGLEGVKAALLRECVADAGTMAPQVLASHIKSLKIPLLRPRPIAEAISSAGGIRLAAIDGNYMLRSLPGVFAAGEMLDWEAPTGGYLLSACFATGRAAARGILDRLA